MRNSQKNGPKQHAKVAKFDLSGIIKKSRSIKEILDPELGIIKYATLTFNDVTEIMKKYSDPMEKSLQILYRQLAPANPGLTIETIKLLPCDVVTRLMVLLKDTSNFLPVKRNPAAEATNLPKGDVP